MKQKRCHHMGRAVCEQSAPEAHQERHRISPTGQIVRWQRQGVSISTLAPLGSALVVRIDQQLGGSVPPRLFGIVFALGQEWYNR